MTGRFMSVFKICVAMGLLVSGAVWADAEVQTLEKVTAGERDKVQAIFSQQQRNFGETCETVKLLKAKALSVAEPVVMGADGRPVSGRWRVRYDVDACGVAGLRMVEMHAMGQGIAIEALAPGETLADAKLQADVQHSFTMAGNVAMPQCREEPVVRDTKVRIFPTTAKDRWQELWIGGMCGRDLGQVVEFLPTKGGTTFKMTLPTATVK